jgi:hypothetical protein
VSTTVHEPTFFFPGTTTRNLGRLSRGRDMLSRTGHRCTYQPAPGGFWTCGHNVVISATDATQAQERAQLATAHDPGQASADGTGRSVADAAEPASEMPTCPTTAPLAAGGHSEAFARAS